MHTSDAITLLYRRAGFGSTPNELQQALPKGYDSVVTNLLDGLDQSSDPQADAVKVPELMQPPFSLSKPTADKSQRLLFNKLLSAERISLASWWIARMVVAEYPLKEKLVIFSIAISQPPSRRSDSVCTCIARIKCFVRWAEGTLLLWSQQSLKTRLC